MTDEELNRSYDEILAKERRLKKCAAVKRSKYKDYKKQISSIVCGCEDYFVHDLGREGVVTVPQTEQWVAQSDLQTLIDEYREIMKELREVQSDLKPFREL